MNILTTISIREREVLHETDLVGERVAGPCAEDVDQGRASPNRAFEELAKTGALGVRIAPRDGGVSSGGLSHVYANEILARYCGTTAFLLQQHTGVSALIAKGATSPRRGEVLSALARGEMVGAIAASHLRRRGPPSLNAERTSGGYLVSGNTPWVSGFGLMTHVLLGAAVSDGRPIFAWLPFRPSDGLAISEALPMSVMAGTATVSVQCKRLFVPDEDVLSRDEANYFASENHGGTLSAHTAFPLGVASRALALIDPVSRRCPSLEASRATISAELAACRARFYELSERYANGSRDQEMLDALLECRVAASTLALRGAASALAVLGGSGNLSTHAAQRCLREAGFYMTSTVTSDFRCALVSRLAQTA